jgi:hypothetical protein
MPKRDHGIARKLNPAIRKKVSSEPLRISARRRGAGDAGSHAPSSIWRGPDGSQRLAVGWKAQGKKVDPSAANKNSADHCKSFAPAFRWHANMGKSKHRVVAGDARRHGIEEPDYRAEERGANRREYNLSNRLGRAAGEDTDNECADDTRAASEGCEAALSHWPRIGDFRADLARRRAP